MPGHLSDSERERSARVQRQLERQAEVETQRADAADAREAKRKAKETREAYRQARLDAVSHRTQELELRILELDSVFRGCVSRRAATVDELLPVDPVLFEPGGDGIGPPEPQEPVMLPGSVFNRAKRRRWFEEQLAAYQRDHERWDADERARRERLAARRSTHERRDSERRRRAQERAERLSVGLRVAEPAAVEEWTRLVIEALPLPVGIALAPAAIYRPEPGEIVVDIHLPGDDLVPVDKSVKYVQAQDADIVRERPSAEREGLYRRLLAQLCLAVTDSVLRSTDGELVESISLNGVLDHIDPATGRARSDYLVSLTTSRSDVDQLALDVPELDPVACLRRLDARLSPHPLAKEAVPAFLTFDDAKYKLATSVDVAAGLDGRANLATIPWQDFEQLVRQLLLAMYGNESRVTRGSRDDGVDGVLFDCDAQIGGTYIVQAKRYSKVVPANDVRALAGVMHDKRANLALFVTSAWFGPDARRFADDNRVRLIEGPELRHLLKEHMDLDVLIPPQRGRRRPA